MRWDVWWNERTRKSLTFVVRAVALSCWNHTFLTAASFLGRKISLIIWTKRSEVMVVALSFSSNYHSPKMSILDKTHQIVTRSACRDCSWNSGSFVPLRYLPKCASWLNNTRASWVRFSIKASHDFFRETKLRGLSFCSTANFCEWNFRSSWSCAFRINVRSGTQPANAIINCFLNAHWAGIIEQLLNINSSIGNSIIKRPSLKG